MVFKPVESPTYTPEVEPKQIARSRFPNWLLGLLALFLLSSGSFAVYRVLASPQAQKRTAAIPVERTTLTQTISANGTIQPETVVNVSPKSAGMLTQLLVKEGNVVKKGQVIARMDDTDLQGQLMQEQGKLARAEANLTKLINGNRPQDIAQAQARVEEAHATLDRLIAGNRSQDIGQAQARLQSAQANLRRASADYNRFEDLYRSGAIAQQALDQKRSDRDTAQAQVNEATQALSLQKVGSRQEDIEQARAQLKQQQEALSLLQAGTRQEDIDQARADVTTARGSLKTIQTQIDDTYVKAPFDGIVLKKYSDPGSFVTPMTAGSAVDSATSSSILALASANHVVASVAESSISAIKLGQPVTITADAYSDKTFQGKVTKIAAQATVKQNVTSFEVEVAILDDTQRILHSGMNAAVDFEVGQLADVLTVPSVAVSHDKNKNVTGVYLAVGNRPPQFRPIITGVTLNNRTEVKEGLRGDEKVVISLPPRPSNSSWFSFPNIFGGNKDQNGPPGGGPPGGGPPGAGGPPGSPPGGGGRPGGGGPPGGPPG